MKSLTSNWSTPQIEMPAMPQMPQMPTTMTAEKGWNTIRQAVTGWTTSPSIESSSSSPYLQRSASQQSNSYQQQETEGEGMWMKIYSAVQSGTANLKSRIGGEDGYESDKDGYEGESHLTRCLKEYYVSKAAYERDLPAWLFTSEQRSTSRSWETSTINSARPTNAQSSRPSQQPYQQSSQSSSLRDIFDNTQPQSQLQQPVRKASYDSGYSSISSASAFQHPNPTNNGGASTTRSGSRAADKLRAMREQRKPSIDVASQPGFGGSDGFRSKQQASGSVSRQQRMAPQPSRQQQQNWL